MKAIFLKFRKNDLTPSSGKQIEFNKEYSREFFELTTPEATVEFTYKSLVEEKAFDGEKIKVVLKLSPSRGDYKVYQNEGGDELSLKTFLRENLRLSEERNSEDYLIISKQSRDRYLFSHIPKDSPYYELLTSLKIDRLYGSGTAYSEAMNAQENPAQIIYFGAPGSGKSYKVAEALAGGDEKNIFRTTFHPDYDYASFVGCYKPEMEKGEIKYAFTPQVFTSAYVRAWEHTDEDVYLVIEEINRGNCAQIFGDLFQLLDRNDEGRSSYPICADKDLASYLQDTLSGNAKQGIAEGKLCLPANLHIIATMNTSDQSLFPMDSAFKRRWDWEYIPINYSDEVKSGQFMITINGKNYKWVTFLEAVNRHIRDLTHSEDKQMGNFFIKNSIEKEAFKSKVMAYLWHEVCKDEYGTQGNFFRSYEEEKKDVKEFSFNELYEKDDDLLLQGFMTFLGVSAIGEESAGEENE